VVFSQRALNIAAAINQLKRTEISVSPEDDVEIRRVTLTNLSARERHIESSYAEDFSAAKCRRSAPFV
jgi:hypothetical protein